MGRFGTLKARNCYALFLFVSTRIEPEPLYVEKMTIIYIGPNSIRNGRNVTTKKANGIRARQ